MSIIGETEKQPREVEVWGANFSKDLDSTDALTAAAHAFIVVKNKIVGDAEEVATNTTVSTPKVRYLLSAGAILTLEDMAVGDRVYVTNKETVTAATVASADLVDGAASVSITALNGRVLVKTADGWVTEATVRVIVDIADNRVRVWMTKGYDRITYIIEITATTSEARVLQDEIVVKVRDD